MKNILIASAGRRVELVNAFKDSVSCLIPKHKVHAIDYKVELSAACQIADARASSPKVSDESYPSFILDYCLGNQIGLVIPTIDTELVTLARHRDEYKTHGINIIVSSTELIEKCRDKRKTVELFEDHGIRYPEIYQQDNLKFPCFAKPFDGSSSIGAKIISSPEALSGDVLQDPMMIFMELIDDKYSEYTLDAYFDRNSELCSIVPRKRLEVRAGEVSKGVTRRNALYNHLLNHLKVMPGAIGCLTIQIFVDETTNDFVGLEINPRFGGGFPLSYAAGADFPGWLIREYLLGEKIEFFDTWVKDLMMLRYDAKVLIYDAT